MEFEILKDKKLKISELDQEHIFRFDIKRACDFLAAMLKIYPKKFDIHLELDKIFNDPNRAYNDLKNAEGFEPFLIESKNDNSSMIVELNLKFLFETCKQFTDDEIHMGYEDQRGNLSAHNHKILIKRFGTHCNITKLFLKEKSKWNSSTFGKNLMVVNFDHRRPLFQKGTNELDNIQIISEYMNREKNKICKICKIPECDECALAFPENNDLIFPTKQSIEKFKNFGKKIYD